ncbi:MAG TPA: DUF885 domain-containing protein [Candidatus Dormibacteraeota bacterium]|nr:DUF885 domain-containing protein [Candidatus Dormibacteraeota bacterium]
MTERPADRSLQDLSEEFFQVMNSTDPLSATMMGVTGFDALVPDPSRAGAERNAARFARIEAQLATIEVESLNDSDRINYEVLGRLAWGARSDLEHGLWEANASAAGYVSPQSMVFQAVPTAPLGDAIAVDSYLQRLSSLGEYFDAIVSRHRQASSEGRASTESGVLQAVEQLDGHLAQPLPEDVLVSLPLPADGHEDSTRARIAELVETQVRPAMRRLRAVLQDELLPVARPDDRVGICFIPGGEEGYRDAVRRHTTTELSPAEIHQIGRDRVATLGEEWSELGGRVLGTTDIAEIRVRLRDDPAFRFSSQAEIVKVVTDALSRAEAARDRWFPTWNLPACVVEEINPIEASNAALAYYRPPTADGSRPAAHCVLTTNPEQRFVYEYEALAFHESSPGHHLQITSAQALTGLPAYRRHLDAELCGYIEGWGLYSERLADEMGLYSSDLQRLGMLSFESLRACRLVVDTGMHHLGWSRQQAIDYMWNNTATTMANVTNEIQRYISWPGQALAYMVGCREIRRLRKVAEERLGARFDIRAFHGAVLSNAAVPLGVLEGVVLRWIDEVPVH